MYTSTITKELAERLKDAGMPMMTSVSIDIVDNNPVVDNEGEKWYRPTYAEVFDWFATKGIYIGIVPRWSYLNKEVMDFLPIVNEKSLRFVRSWDYAASSAIEKALELL